jgi:hypothetical protein
MPDHERETESLRDGASRRKDPVLLSAVCILAFLALVLTAGWHFLRQARAFRWSTGNPSPTLRVQNEIRQLAVTVEMFRARYGFYPPSRLKLCERLKDYEKRAALDKDSMEIIRRMWPNIAWDQGVDWNVNGRIDSWETGGVSVLEGDQCLVFFLGGIPTPPGSVSALGFSDNRRDPTSRKDGWRPCFFEFDSSRLISLSQRPNRFCSYLDCFRRQPYVYFSSYDKRNGYNRYWSEFRNSDCMYLGVWPYASRLGPPTEYLNPNTFQILSAGADGLFGTGTILPHGGTWTPQTSTEIDPPGRDDLANFCDGKLGARSD